MTIGHCLQIWVGAKSVAHRRPPLPWRGHAMEATDAIEHLGMPYR
jgi:hypothetical protein